MIVKGRARSGPEQLAAYLMRDDGTERATVLDYGDDLHNDFLLYHTLGDAGRTDKTLYHAQICPEAKYGRELTPEEWLRLAEMLAEDMGMAHHPRRVVLHDGGDKPHVHVVFQRCDPETLKMWEVWQNFKKHEQASLRMSKEFGMEIIPGKHAKRDREKQPEFPRQEMTEAEAQQEKRTGLNLADRKAEIAELYGAASTGQSFKNAVEAAGYVLAQGEKGYLIVDTAGGHSLIQRNIKGLKKAEVDRFMADVPMDKLPTLDEAKALQKERAETAVLKPVERSKFLQPEAPAKVEEPAPAPPPSKFLPEQPSGYDPEYYSPAKVAERASKFLTPAALAPPAPVVAPPQAPEPAPQPPSKFLPPAATPPAPQPSQSLHTPKPDPDWTEKEVASKFNALQPAPPTPPAPPKEDFELRRLRKAVFKRQQEDYQKFTDANSAAYRAFGTQLDYAMRWKMEDFDQIQAQARQDLVLRQTPQRRTGLRGMLDAIADKLNPEATEQKAAEQKEDRDTLRLQQISDRIEYMKRLDLDKAEQLQALRARQLQEQAAREKAYNEELDRHIKELLKVREIAHDLAAEERQKKEDDAAREASGWADDFKKEQEYPYDDGPPEKGKG
jgi:hypothetical protein